MADRQCIELLGEWEGYRLGTVGRVDAEEVADAEQPEAWIELLPSSRHARRCSGCGRTGLSVHDVQERWIRDLPILGMMT